MARTYDKTKILMEVNNLTKVYPGVQPVYAIRDISLTVNEGEFLAVIGPSGSGKSTFMNVLGLLDKASEGVLKYHGEDTQRWDEGRKAAFRNRQIGFIFQAHMLLPEFTALENVLIPSRIGGTYGKQAIENARHILNRIGLADRMTHRPAELSGGQNQRVAIARALVNNPRIVFADEPTGALDSKTSESVYELMREINKEEGVTFMIVTHEKALAVKTDRIISLLDGKVQSDEPQAAVTEPGSPTP